MSSGVGYPTIYFDPTQPGNGNVQRPDGISVGDVVRLNGKSYIFVKFDNGVGNVAIPAAGRALYWMDKVQGIVTSDKTGSQFGAAVPAGVAGITTAEVTNGWYTWLQTGGPCVVRLDGPGALGNKVCSPASDTDFLCTTVTLAAAAAALIPAPLVGMQMGTGGAGNDQLVDLMLAV